MIMNKIGPAGNVAKRGISYLEKPLLDADIKDYAKMINKAAVKSKDFAFSLVEEGVRGNVTSKVISNKLDGSKDVFDFSGKLTDKAKAEMTEGMIKKGIPLDIKIKDALDLFIKGVFS